MDVIKVREILKKYNQEQTIKYYEELSEKQKENLLKQIEKLDLENINKRYQKSKSNEKLKNRFAPLEYIDKNKISKEKEENFNKIGKENLKHLALVTMAGGQASRLGIVGPKGKLYIDKISKTLFEVAFDNVKLVKEKYNQEIFWLIMTSKENYLETKKYFEEKDYFGYNKEKIIFFKQGEEPILDINGKIVLETKSKIKLASNGNGDVFNAIEKNKILDKLKKQDVRYLAFMGIDNILANPIDLLLLGMLIEKNYEIASKSIMNKSGKKCSVFCKIDNKPSILEYCYVTDELLNLKDKNDNYLYRDENILMHLMTLEAVEKSSKNELKYHRAYRKSTFLDENGKSEKQESFKFEKFIFDAFNYFDNMLLLRVNPDEEFAPIKKEEDIENAVKLYLNKNKI